MHKVLITGVTGFLGSHIAEHLIANNIGVVGLKRKSSDIWRCNEFKENIEWVDIDDEGMFVNQLKKHSFDTIVHGAWIGVESHTRNNWGEQSKNISFFVTLLEIAKELDVKKIVFLGSQAEYGLINEKVNEDYPVNALNAYASTKLACLQIMETFCSLNNIDWVWLRLFSLFGEKENSNWLIPSLINSMLNEKEMDFTSGEQKYAYLYVKDYAEIMRKIVTMKIDSGIYNISSNQTITIKSLIENIKNHINPKFILNFGALNYRAGQSMHMEGDIKKISSQIGEIEFSNFEIALQNTLKHYLKK
ncbi:NAD-dependent epimerase/dehydratase family protein [Flavobacterium psychroterrae]|uniref:NAD-dependent epimerase/dehydratase family protein n=1 Tax=Flavobacterium psychroterrae TaxID=2133767 RepID=A0ABS5PCA4_9FLAO|nr:NAD-dependent epimerase/dehydratase family protein [Flavobacterium psychroterrae]MBS7231932.1 NAD-dependent epimerase/dehydratase family protein [Flavobacterium psychroterrae]